MSDRPILTVEQLEEKLAELRKRRDECKTSGCRKELPRLRLQIDTAQWLLERQRPKSAKVRIQ